jgi:hypothetical protein
MDRLRRGADATASVTFPISSEDYCITHQIGRTRRICEAFNTRLEV